MSEMNQMNVSNARKNIYRLIDEVNETHIPVLLTGKNNDAVLISKEDWNAMQETLFLMGIPGMTESILKAEAEPVDEATLLEDIEW
jgi:antitoxin YefM